MEDSRALDDPTSAQKKILIVDDDPAITQQLFWTLCDEYDVMTANDLASAVRRVTIYEPAVSILDLHLPPVPDSPAAPSLTFTQRCGDGQSSVSAHWA